MSALGQADRDEREHAGDLDHIDADARYENWLEEYDERRTAEAEAERDRIYEYDDEAPADALDVCRCGRLLRIRGGEWAHLGPDGDCAFPRLQGELIL